MNRLLECANNVTNKMFEEVTIEMERYSVAILGLTETRLIGFREIRTGKVVPSFTLEERIIMIVAAWHYCYTESQKKCLIY